VGLKSADGIPEWKRDLPPLPRWDLVKTRERANKIYDIVRLMKTTVLTTDIRAELAGILQNEFSLSDKATLAAMNTLLPYHEKELTNELARILCFQFAANWAEIKKGHPVHKFTGVPAAMWIPLEIRSFAAQQRGRHVFTKMLARILDGCYAGYEAERVFPVGYLPVFARDLGYSRRRMYEEPSDLVLFKFAAWVEPSSKEDIQFSKYWLTPYMEKHNTYLAKKRKPTEKELEGSHEEDPDS
jgi:hypothetical protein